MDLTQAELEFYQMIKRTPSVLLKRSYVASLVGIMGDDAHCLRLALNYFVQQASAEQLDGFADFCAESARKDGPIMSGGG